MRAGIAIVGGGMMGAWVALEASRRADPLGGPAVLFEAANSDELGVVECGLAGEAFVAPALAGLGRVGLREAAGFETNTGRPVQFGRPGATVLGLGDVEAAVASMQGRRIEGVHSLANAELAAKFYGLEVSESERGVWLPEVAHLNADVYYKELLGLARTRGAITRFGSGVTAVRVESGRVLGVETSRGFCEAARVVIAAPEYLGLAGWSLSDLGLATTIVERCRFRSPLVAEEAGCGLSESGGGLDGLLQDPAKVESFFAPGEPPIHAHPALVDLGRGLRAWCDPASGSLVASGCLKDAGIAGGGPFCGDPLELVLGRLPFHGQSLEPVGGVERVEIVARESGVPVVCPVPDVDGLFVAVGLGERGVELAPSLAEGVCQMVEGRAVSAFDPGVLGFS